MQQSNSKEGAKDKPVMSETRAAMPSTLLSSVALDASPPKPESITLANGIAEEPVSSLQQYHQQKPPPPQVQPETNSEEDEEMNEQSEGFCANCNTLLATTWRQDASGNKVCKNCSLYWKLHVTDQVQEIIQELQVSPTELKCPKCDHVESSTYFVANKANLEAHIKLMHSDMRLCGVCDFSTYGSEQLRRHMQMVHYDMKQTLIIDYDTRLKIKEITKYSEIQLD